MKAVVIGLAFAALAAGGALAAENGVGEANTSAPAAASTPAFRVGALVKDDKGSALGRITKVIPATSNEPAKISIRIGDENHIVPQAQVTTKDGVLVYKPGNVQAIVPFN